MVEEISARNGVTIYEKQIEKNQDWLRQVWTFYLAPTEDEIDLLWVIQSKESGLFNYYGVQQCFRMSGKSNSAWRREIAETPAFSEYDLWNSQKDLPSRTSLSWVLRHNAWQTLPAMDSCVAAQTPSGLGIDSERFPQKPPTVIGPYKGLLQESIDCGLHHPRGCRRRMDLRNSAAFGSTPFITFFDRFQTKAILRTQQSCYRMCFQKSSNGFRQNTFISATMRRRGSDGSLAQPVRRAFKKRTFRNPRSFAKRAFEFEKDS